MNSRHNNNPRWRNHKVSVSPPIDFSVNDIVFEKKRLVAAAPVDWGTNDICFKENKPRNSWSSDEADYNMYTGPTRQHNNRYNEGGIYCNTPSMYKGQNLYYNSQAMYDSGYNSPSPQGVSAYSRRMLSVQCTPETDYSYYPVHLTHATIPIPAQCTPPTNRFLEQNHNLKNMSQYSLERWSDSYNSPLDNRSNSEQWPVGSKSPLDNTSSHNYLPQYTSEQWSDSSNSPLDNTSSHRYLPQYTSEQWSVGSNSPVDNRSSHNYLPQYSSEQWSDSSSLLEVAKTLDNLNCLDSTSGVTVSFDFKPLEIFKAENHPASKPEQSGDQQPGDQTQNCVGSGDEELNLLVEQIINE